MEKQKKKGVLEVIEENSNSSNYFNHILKILKTVKGYKEKKELTFGDIILNFKDIEFDLIAQNCFFPAMKEAFPEHFD